MAAAPEAGRVHGVLHLPGRDGRQLVEGRGVVGGQQLRRAHHPGRPRVKAVLTSQRQRLRGKTQNVACTGIDASTSTDSSIIRWRRVESVQRRTSATPGALHGGVDVKGNEADAVTQEQPVSPDLASQDTRPGKRCFWLPWAPQRRQPPPPQPACRAPAAPAAPRCTRPAAPGSACRSRSCACRASRQQRSRRHLDFMQADASSQLTQHLVTANIRQLLEVDKQSITNHKATGCQTCNTQLNNHLNCWQQQPWLEQAKVKV